MRASKLVVGVAALSVLLPGVALAQGWSAVPAEPPKAAAPRPDLAKPEAPKADAAKPKSEPLKLDAPGAVQSDLINKALPPKAPGKPGGEQARARGGLDNDADGTLDRLEMRRARQEAFIRMDADHDGKLTRPEIVLVRDSLVGAWNARNPGADPANRPPPLDVDFFFKTNDRNSDGAISMEEFLSVVEDRFARFDLNKDGKITKAEAETVKAQQAKK